MRWRVLFVGVAILATACGGSTTTHTASKGTTLSGTVHVLAASSLTEAFTAMGKTFEGAHPGVKVSFDFAASSALAEQIAQGAPADVFASADEANMKKVTDAGKATGATVFARNRLALLVAKGNPKGIHSLGDLAKPGVVFVVCAPQVPCGKFGAAALAKARVTAKPASLEDNVKAVVAKVTLGEVDAGIVYATDVKAAGAKAEGIAIDIAVDPALEAVYPIAVTADSSNPTAARAWVDAVLSAAGQRTLAAFGFLPR